MKLNTPVKKSNLPLISLLLVFILPILVGVLLYFFHGVIPFKTLHHGELMRPAFEVPDYWKNKVAQRKWNIIYLTREPCDNDTSCQKIFHTLLQIQKALGKNSERVAANKIVMESSSLLPHTIYLVDPGSLVFMAYPETVNPIFILKDLKRVLEVSQIG